MYILPQWKLRKKKRNETRALQCGIKEYSLESKNTKKKKEKKSTKLLYKITPEDTWSIIYWKKCLCFKFDLALALGGMWYLLGEGISERCIFTTVLWWVKVDGVSGSEVPGHTVRKPVAMPHPTRSPFSKPSFCLLRDLPLAKTLWWSHPVRTMVCTEHLREDRCGAGSGLRRSTGLPNQPCPQERHSPTGRSWHPNSPAPWSWSSFSPWSPTAR